MKNRNLFRLYLLLLSLFLITSCSESPKEVFMHQCVNNSNALINRSVNAHSLFE
ncbi:hypothetical protein PROSTU_04714 [Providencia stuartii ATCC 25827]|uniref:Lipoprotein n=1 Tax=Providencia stuartii ATCC 25827 TaxID=471874 RepID=A0AA86YS76_PROST|nr:hypothetical protein PROSTU_04714 [Providencia stuartii ATCC 25827]